MKKIKNVTLLILSAVGILYLINLFRQFNGQDDIDVDVEPIIDRIKEGEKTLEVIETSDPDVDDIIEKWND